MHQSVEDKIINALDIEPNEVEETVTVANVCCSTGDPEKDADDDLEHARQNLRLVLEKAQDALDTTIEFARASEKPQAYEAIAAILSATTSAANTLMGVHKTRREITKKAEANGSTTVNQTAVFVGSTNELLKMIRDATKPVLDVDGK